MTSANRPRAGEDITVLESFPTPRTTTNPYITMLGRALVDTPGITMHTFSWRAALLGRYDVFHVHWPEILVSGRDPLRRSVRRIMYAAFVTRLRLTKTPVVRTVHNLAQHENASRLDVWLLRQLEHLTTVRIAINELTPNPTGAKSTVILHGHYRDWFDAQPNVTATPGAITFFGLIRAYKGVDTLIAAVRQLPLSADATLRIAGKATPTRLGEELVALAEGDPRITITTAFVPDEELAQLVQQSELVVLPYREMLNSGGALAALSLGCPILVPANGVTNALADEVGEAWVQRYRGTLTADDILRALAAVRGSDSGAPDLTRRQWDLAGRQHREAFRLAMTRRGGHV